MKTWEHIPEDFEKEAALCIGKFDGFHRGHRLLLDEALKTDGAVTVLTFAFNHTLTIDSAEEKRRLAKKLKVGYYVEIQAGQDFFSLTPEQFVSTIVRDRFHARHVIVGEDFRFGHERAGDITTLRKMSGKYGYELHAIPKIQEGGEDISSSRIRNCISNGRMEEAELLLGRAYRIEGVVTRGNQVGREIGVPTANIYPDSGKILPPYGVYAVRVQTGDHTSQGIANLGVKPTVGDSNPTGLEVHVFNENCDLYDRRISVFLTSYLREERKFETMEELQEQIELDMREAKRRLEK